MSMARYFSPRRVWSYQYNVHDRADTAAGLGVPHTVETPAIWGPPNGFGDKCSYATYHAAVVPVVMDLWISFVKALDPNPYRDARKTPYWQSWGTTGSSGGRRLKIQLKNMTMEGVPAEQIEKCKFWKSLASTTEQ